MLIKNINVGLFFCIKLTDVLINKNAILYIGRDLRSQGHNYSGNMGVFIGTDDEWEKLDRTLPSGGILY